MPLTSAHPARPWTALAQPVRLSPPRASTSRAPARRRGDRFVWPYAPRKRRELGKKLKLDPEWTPPPSAGRSRVRCCRYLLIGATNEFSSGLRARVLRVRRRVRSHG